MLALLSRFEIAVTIGVLGAIALVRECLGNTVPHLHIAVIPRYRSDPRWGRPVWTTSRDELPKTLADDAECERLALALREHIESV